MNSDVKKIKESTTSSQDVILSNFAKYAVVMFWTSQKRKFDIFKKALNSPSIKMMEITRFRRLSIFKVEETPYEVP